MGADGSPPVFFFRAREGTGALKLIEPFFVFDFLRQVFIGDERQAAGGKAFEFHLELVGQHLLDFALPRFFVLEPRIGHDFLGAFAVVVVELDADRTIQFELVEVETR